MLSSFEFVALHYHALLDTWSIVVGKQSDCKIVEKSSWRVSARKKHMAVALAASGQCLRDFLWKTFQRYDLQS